jgi:hypothetical protein
MKKRHRLAADEIRPLALGRGSCIASDMILVDGEPVRYMYREDPDNELDSGWRFFAGVEPQSYADEAANFALYDVNTLVNYDVTILPFLDEPPGSAFEKDDSGRFARVPFPTDPEAN